MDLLLIKCREEYNVEKLKRILEPYDIKISEKFEETGKLFEEQELMVHTDKAIGKTFMCLMLVYLLKCWPILGIL